MPSGAGVAPVEAAINKLKESLKGEDTAAIKADTEALEKSVYAISEKLYQASNPGAGAAGAQTNPGADPSSNQGEGYYDASFTETDDNQDNK